MIRRGILINTGILFCSGVACAGLAITALAPNDCKDTICFTQEANAGRVTLNASELAQLKYQIELKGGICNNIGLPLPKLTVRK